MQISEKIIKAPAVDNLDILKKIIQSLEYTPIPYSYIDERNLEELEKKKKISPQVHRSINEWKDSHGISHAKGLLQSIVSLLRSLDIITNVKIKKEDLDAPLGFSGPMLNTFLTKSNDAIMLTRIGYTLLNLLKKNGTQSRNEYDNILFWRFLHSNITHNFQRLFEDINTYTEGIEDTLKKFETDTRARAIFIRWINYFDLKGVRESHGNSIILSKKKIIKKIISSTILELNTLKPEIYSTEVLSNRISQQLDLSNTIFNFLIIFEIILKHTHTSDEQKNPIEGTTSSRVSLSLPNFPKINMLKIHSSITIDQILKNATESEFNSVLNFGDYD